MPALHDEHTAQMQITCCARATPLVACLAQHSFGFCMTYLNYNKTRGPQTDPSCLAANVLC